MIRNGYGFPVVSLEYFRYFLKNTGIGIGRWRVFKPQIRYNPKNIQWMVVDIILTGRYAPKVFIQKADLVTEMKEIKHPF